MAFTFKFGKRPARPADMKLKFNDVLDASNLPTPPTAFGHYNLIDPNSYGILGNDKYGDCVFAGAAHEEMLFVRVGQYPSAQFTDANVLSDYSAVTGFNPADPKSDQGTDMLVAASYRRRTGVVDAAGTRHRVDAYVGIARADLSQVALAAYLFGACGCGFEFPNTAMDQFDKGQPFRYVPGAKIEGGHYMPCVGRFSNGYYALITWGKVIAASPTWMRRYMDEAVAYVSREIIAQASQRTPEGFDLAALDSFLNDLGPVEDA